MKLSDAIERGRAIVPTRGFGRYYDDRKRPTEACDLGCALIAAERPDDYPAKEWPCLEGPPIEQLPVTHETLAGQIAEINDFNMRTTAEVVAALREAGL